MSAETKTRKWLCPACGHIQEGEERPEVCDFCSAIDIFEPYEGEEE